MVGVPQARPLPEPGMEEDAEMKLLLLLESAQDICICIKAVLKTTIKAVVGVPQARPLPEPGMEEDAEMKLLLLESAQDGGERRDEAAEIQKV